MDKLGRNVPECDPFSNSPLTQRQIRSIPFFVFSKNIEEGARKAKISKNTYYRWSKNELFREQFRKFREETIKEAVGRIELSVDRAADVMLELLENKDESIRLRAAQGIIHYFFRISQARLEERVQKIEELLLEGRGPT